MEPQTLTWYQSRLPTRVSRAAHDDLAQGRSSQRVNVVWLDSGYVGGNILKHYSHIGNMQISHSCIKPLLLSLPFGFVMEPTLSYVHFICSFDRARLKTGSLPDRRAYRVMSNRPKIQAQSGPIFGLDQILPLLVIRLNLKHFMS